MGLFNRNKKVDKIEHLKPCAGNIVEMLKTQLKGNVQIVLLFASGLAGIACHEAVKAKNEAFSVVETKAGKKYYFGNAVNKYLLEDTYSVYSFCSGIVPIPKNTSETILARFSANVGDPNFKIWDSLEIEESYTLVKECWDGIFNNMTGKACKSAEEWPILMGIVLQNVILWASVKAPKEQLVNMALDCANVLSKMDQESL